MSQEPSPGPVLRTDRSKGTKPAVLTVRIPEQLRREVKAKAALQGVSVNTVAENLLARWVEGQLSFSPESSSSSEPAEGGEGGDS